ncbi:MAG: hypothetical protein P4M09_17405 [Devosia sp.]|nr:hypothetical protein [Devosia sp.]
MAHFWHTPAISDIEAQKHWELEGVERGVRRVRAELESQKVSDSQLGAAIAQRAAPQLIEKIKAGQKAAEDGLATITKGRPAPWWYQILMLPADKLAVIVIKNVLSFQPRDFTFNPPLTGLAKDIHRSILDQLEYEDWRGADKVTVDRYFEKHRLTPRNLKRLRERMEQKRVERWDATTGIQFGVVLLTMLAEAVPDWFLIDQARLRGGRYEYQFIITPAAREVLFKITEQSELSQPALMPMLCPPADWQVAA